ncbi:MAG: hypothetical protein JKY03_04880 [Aureispira sp.]|nr:hypothetical protein [Aureispira sp.]
MKTRLVYLLLILCCFGIGCQEKYSDAILVEYVELDKSLKRSNNFIEHTTRGLIMKLEEDASIRTQLQFLVKKAREIHDASIDLNTFIYGLRDSLILKTGGYYEEEVFEIHKEFLRYLPKGARNIDLVEDILFRNNFSNLDSTATLSNVIILDQKIQALYDQYVQIIESCWDDGGLKASIFADFDKKEAAIQNLKKQFSLPSSINYKSKEHNNQTWVVFNFKDKSLAAVLPLLSKIQNDIRLSEYALISFFNTQFSGCNFTYDPIDVFAQSSKSSIRLGETFEAEIALGTYSSEAIFEIVVNGDTLNQIQGKSIYRVRPNKTGEQHYNATIHHTHPLTGETTTFRKAFYFEVIP